MCEERLLLLCGEQTDYREHKRKQEKCLEVLTTTYVRDTGDVHCGDSSGSH